MSSNLYLFDPKQVQSNSGEKSLIQVMREAEIARAEESARIVKSFASRVFRLFGGKKPAPAANSVAAHTPKTVDASAAEERLAA